MKKAYELRGQVSEREKFIIDINYYNDVTGELAKEISTCEVWRQTYPRDPADRTGASPSPTLWWGGTRNPSKTFLMFCA